MLRWCSAAICTGARTSPSTLTACSHSPCGISVREELVLVRDRMGVTPLFFFPTTDGVIFSSEPKGILAHPAVQPKVTRDGFRELLVLARNPGCTVYSGMYEVRPGEVVRVRRGGLTKRHYWKLTASPHEHELSQTITTVASLLDDIVRRQLVGDVPVCTMLSGGLDSSAITALAQRATLSESGHGIPSYSVDFSRSQDGSVTEAFPETDDSPYVRAFVAHTGCDHVNVVLDSHTLASPEVVRAVVRASDFPLSTSGDMFTSMYRLFEKVRADFTVALSGIAADEVFGGYPWCHVPALVNAQTFPWFFLSENGFAGLAGDFLEHLDLPAFRADSYAQAIAEVPVLPGEDAHARRTREINYLNLTRFVCFLLDRLDRLSMALGLEVRVPFCDHRLVEYVFNTPWSMQRFDGREKSILRAATRELLPPVIAARSKSGYPSTPDPGYDRALRAAVADMMAESAHPCHAILNRKAIQAMLARTHRSPNAARADRVSLERVHAMSTWIKDYGIALDP